MYKKQTGSAATGFMIGLLVGLLIAVAIAFFVAKVPVNTLGTEKYPTGEGQGSEGGTAAMGSISSDPNAMLYSRQVPSLPPSGGAGSQVTVSTVNEQGQLVPNPAVDPNSNLASDATSSSNANPNTTGNATANVGGSTKPESDAESSANAKKPNQDGKKPVSNKAGTDTQVVGAKTPAAASGGNEKKGNESTAQTKGDSLTDIIKAKEQKSGETKGSTPGTASTFDYFVQAGAFRNKQEAEQVRAKLQSLGVSARLSERVQSDGTVYRVRSGPFAQRSSADSARDKLTSSGLEAVIVSVPR